MKPLHYVVSPTRIRPLNIFLGLMLSLVSLMLLLALATYHPADPSLNTATPAAIPHNYIGLFGAALADLLLQALGLAAFLIPLWLGQLGWAWMRSRPAGSAFLRLIGSLMALAFLPTVFALLPYHWLWRGAVPFQGVVGRLLADFMIGYLNIQGTWLVAATLAAAGLYFAFAISLQAILESFQDRWLTYVQWRDRRRDEREEAEEERRLQEEGAIWHSPTPRSVAYRAPEHGDELPARPRRFASLFGRRERPVEDELLDEIPAYQRTGFTNDDDDSEPAPARRASIWERAVAEPESEPAVTPQPYQPPVAAAAPRPPAARTAQQPALRPAPFQSEAAPAYEPQPIAIHEIAIHDRADADLRTAPVAPKHVSGFKLPPSTLLNPGDGPQKVRENELRQEAKTLVEKCAEFDVRGQIVQINPGPMVTTYEFKPEAGVKYSRVTSLADDLCLAMRAESILIERMPGKSTVGIQVPNHERETIHLREVIESENFLKAKSRLAIAMGKDINGRIMTADLAAMPHVLIAGSTGSGKSVAINAMIMSLLFRTTPAQVRLILVDPKRVELGMYEGVPHLFTPIITEPKLAANALRNAVREMERRLKLLASRSVRNIDQYNKLFEGGMPSLFDSSEDEEPLPYIVIIIDELADLMMLDRANVEESITRLAQMARAVGIHLILATQRPSVDVITGLIKANVPTRISFRLATKVDSRTILDTNGAESLLGRGDMLFLPPGSSRLMRLHAPYVSEKETAAVVAFWKAQGEAEYVHGFLESPKDERAAVDGSNPDPEENDPMFDDAVRLVFEFGKASTSLLQRRLRIGYGRAAHLIDLMERDGLVGGADGSKPRELLKAPNWLHEVSASAND